MAGADHEEMLEPHRAGGYFLVVPNARNGLWYEESGSGEPLVLLHENVVDSRVWARVVPLLADRFQVVVYDQRGYGRSPMWDGPYSPIDDLLGILDAAGIERATLVGASRGGRIALSAALAVPDRVCGLVLLGSSLPGHQLTIEGTPEQETRWKAAAERGDLATLAEIDMELWAPLGVIADADHMIPWRAPLELARLVREFLS